MLFRHKITRVVYRYLASAIDRTDSREFTPVIVYCPDDNEHTIYVKEATEFDKEFEFIDTK